MTLPLPTSVARLPFADRVVRLSRDESSALNQAVMRECCHPEKLLMHFYDALKQPCRVASDGQGSRGIAEHIPTEDRHKDVIIACDVGGWFRLPAAHAASFLEDGGPWTVEVYVIAPDLSWLIGYREPTLYLQGRAAVQVNASSA